MRQSKTASSVFIALVLAYQVAMPLRYYLSGGGTDERFSWRMFSTLRMLRCSVEVQDRLGSADGGHKLRPVALVGVVHSAWINLLERGRMPVVDKLLARRCEQPGVRSASYTRTCKNTDGSSLPPQQVERACEPDAARRPR